jgi:leucyl aminopeptidase
VIEALGAIAELGLELNVVAVCPATENLPSGSAIKPGDIITQYNGRTVEVNNTDAEGRLILADALAFCAEQEGVARIVDLATLTGAIILALGSTYAGLMSNVDDLAERVAAAGERAGELAWRLPLHEEYKDLTRGKVADLTNASEKRKASSIYAASFLEEFVDGTPWAHLDIAGTSWGVDREYVGSGASGYGVRLLVSLARDLASAA